MKTRIIFFAVVTPVAAIGRMFWRRHLGLGLDREAVTYWRHRRDVVTADALKTKP